MRLIDVDVVIERLDFLITTLEAEYKYKLDNAELLGILDGVRDFIANRPTIDVAETDEYKKLLENAKILDAALREYQRKYE